MSVHLTAKTQILNKPSFIPVTNGLLQRAAVNSSPASKVPSIVYEVLRSPGQPLDAETRAFMEPRFGHDFSGVPAYANTSPSIPARLSVGTSRDPFEQEADAVADQITRTPLAVTANPYDFGKVRIHTDGQAAESARQMNAQAYTVGNHIVFDTSEYAPQTVSGQRLMAHELTHVLQQRGNWIQLSNGGDNSDVIDRGWLIERIGFRMNLAYPKYVDAASEHQRRLREIAADQAAIASLALDVFFSFATPGLGRFLERAIARGVRTEASLLTYRLALSVMDRSDQIIDAGTAVGKDVAVSVFKNVIARDESTQFVEDLKQAFSVALDRIHASLPSKTDEELSVLYANYDPEIANFQLYEEQIGQLVRRYQAQVAPIGKRRSNRDIGWHESFYTLAYWVVNNDGTRSMALLDRYTNPGVSGAYLFDTWISQEFEQIAISKTESSLGMRGRGIFSVPRSAVTGL